jgi:hypothetical protein
LKSKKEYLDELGFMGRRPQIEFQASIVRQSSRLCIPDADSFKQGGCEGVKIVGFWKINTNIEAKKLGEVAAKLLEKGVYPPEGMEIKEWLICPGGKGIIVAEVPDEKAAYESWAVWTAALPGYFEWLEMSPAVEAHEAIAIALGSSDKKKSVRDKGKTGPK